MSAMSRVEVAACRSAPWRSFAQRVVVPWALSGAPVGGEALEIGGGSGAMAEAVLTAHPALRMTVTDLDPRMVDTARHRLGDLGDRVEVREADATRLPFETESYDTVFTWLMLHHTLEWEAVLGEAFRVLRPGGRIVGYDLVDTAASRLVHRLDRSPHRFAGRQALERELRAGATSVQARSGLAGLVHRFVATK